MQLTKAHGQARSASRSVSYSRRASVRTQALFGWGKKDVGKEEAKEEQYRMQQELLEERRSGGAIRKANERRQKVAETLAARKAERREERDALARGEVSESLGKWRNYSNKEDENITSGVVVPLLPFGMPKFDAGERFDLRSPYVDDGWVDPEETDAFAGIKRIGEKLLNFTGKSPKIAEKKPVIWASEYNKVMAEKRQAARQAAKKKPE